MASWLRQGNIRGPQGPVGPPGPQGLPGQAGEGFTGEIRPCILTTPPAGWLMLNGQTIANAATAWPALWALPGVATWKSSTNLVLPNMTDRTLLGASASAAVGTVGGANSRAIPLGALPSHSHPMPHTHEHPHTHTIAHVHSIAHDHAAFNTSNPLAGHRHGLSMRQTNAVGSTGSSMQAGTTGTTTAQMTGYDEEPHIHQVNVPSFAGNSGAASPATSGQPSDATSGQPSVSATSATGSGAAMDMTPAHMRVNWMIKAAA